MKLVKLILVLSFLTDVACAQSPREPKLGAEHLPVSDSKEQNLIYSQEYRQLLSLVYENKAKIEAGSISKEILSELRVNDNNSENRLGTLETFYSDQLGKQDNRIEDLNEHINWFFSVFGLILAILGYLTFRVTSKNIEQETLKVTTEWREKELPKIREELKEQANKKIKEQILERAKIAEEQVNSEVENAKMVIEVLNTLLSEAEIKFEDIKRIHLEVEQKERDEELDRAKQRSRLYTYKGETNTLAKTWLEMIKDMKQNPPDQKED